MAHRIEKLDKVAVRQDGESRGQSWHGLEIPVFGALTPEEFAQKAGLDFKICELPVLVQGKTENRKDENHKALVHCGNGRILDIVSNDYKVMQPSDLISIVARVCEDMGAEMESGGTLRDQHVGFLSARLPQKYSVKGRNGANDEHFMYANVSTGWIDGFATSVDLSDVRTVCYNTVMLSRDQVMKAGQGARFRQTHKTAWDLSKELRALEILKVGESLMREYYPKMQRMTDTSATPKEMEAIVISLLDPKLSQEALKLNAAQTGSNIIDAILEAPAADVVGKGNRPVMQEKVLLESIMALDASAKEERNRSVKVVMDLLNSQPGADMTRGSVAHAFNGITYWQTHVRGNRPDSRLESNLRGEGKNLKSTALDTCISYCDVLELLHA